MYRTTLAYTFNLAPLSRWVHSTLIQRKKSPSKQPLASTCPLEDLSILYKCSNRHQINQMVNQIAQMVNQIAQMVNQIHQIRKITVSFFRPVSSTERAVVPQNR